MEFNFIYVYFIFVLIVVICLYRMQKSKGRIANERPYRKVMGDPLDCPLPYIMSFPANPLDEKSFCKIFDFMAVHNKNEITIRYTIPYRDEYEQKINMAIRYVINEYFYQRPDYYCYSWDITARIHQTSNNLFDLVISMGTIPVALGCINKRKESFLYADSIIDTLYKDNTLRERMTERERAKIILKALASIAEYKNDGSRICHSPWTIFIKGYGVCDAFTAAYNMLLHADGIACHGQKGIIRDNCLHEWTVATLDGEVCDIDVSRYVSTVIPFRNKYFSISNDKFSE